MNQIDKKYRPYLRDYLQRIGVTIVGAGNSLKVCCPAHAENSPSCAVNDETLFCYGCGFHGDIYDLVGETNGIKGLREQSDYLDNFYGESPPPPPEAAPVRISERGRAVPMHPDKAATTYSLEAIKDFVDFIKSKGFKNPGKPESILLYKNKFGQVEAADVRFVDGKEKAVIMFWHNGRSLVMKNPPLLVYGRDLLEQQKELPVLIVEGAKCADKALCIPGLVPISWSHGTQNAGKVDWSVLKERQVFIYPDDDEPGAKAALQIKLRIPSAVIIEPLEEARKIKEKGADIVEALQVKTPEALAHYILNFTNPASDGPTTGEWKPFTVLGTADDNRLYCVDRHGRLQSYDPKTIGKTKLLTLADLIFWTNMFPKKGGFNVDEASDWLIAQGEPDFDVDTIRGRGAWSEKNGDICYHDGRETIGKPSSKRMYIRKVRKDIGLDAPHPDASKMKRVRDIVMEFTFKTNVDACRLLNWSTLAPFGGALPWRPAILVTGESGSGKSTIMDQVLRPLSMGLARTGGGSTEAGIRQAVQNDSRAIILEEAEGDTPTKRQLREALFSLMRQSTSDDAPQIAKGTAGDQRGLTFTMRSMFCFLSIDPEIEHSADDNRMFRINLVKADKSREDYFRKLETELRGLLTEETCNGIRALTFSRLQEIIEIGRRIAPIVRDCSGRDMRFGVADGLLWACYWLIWDGRKDVTDEFAREFLTRAYGARPEEPRRNDAAEMIERIMDQVIETTGDTRKKMTIRESCMHVHYGAFENHDVGFTMQNEIVGALGRIGIKVLESGSVAFASRHHELRKILESGIDYARSLGRHPGIEDRAAKMRLAGAQRVCVVIGGILENETPVQERFEIDEPDPSGKEY